MPAETVGMIGLGIMGSAMSANLVAAGFQVVGYDTVAQRRREHRAIGGIAARSCRDVVNRCTVIVTSLPSSEALISTAQEFAAAGNFKQIIIEASTLPIAVKEEARTRVAKRGVTVIDCPLSGTGAQARTKDLIVYASGSLKAYKRAAAVMDGFARAHYHVGPFGAGSKVKFIANLLVAIHNVAAAEAMVLAMKAGLDPGIVLKVVADGAGSSRMLQVRGPLMVAGDYSEAMMKVKVWQKDMNIISEFAREFECPTPLFSASASIYTAAIAMGFSGEDTAAVCAVLEKMANHSRTPAVAKSRSR
jgi:putative dehydrogenase